MRAVSRLLVAILVVAVSACRDAQQPPVAATASIADSADQVLFGMQFLTSTQGIKRGDVKADTAYILEDGTRFDLRKAHVVFTTETGAPQGTMDADKGMFSTRSQILEGWGNVVLKLVDGRTLTSPHVIYNQVTHVISSDTTYTITGPQGTQTGIGFQSNQSFSSFKCLRNCGGNFSVVIPER